MKIVFYHPFGFDFNGDSIYDKNGLGGSETSILYISRYLAELGNEVYVYCVCSRQGRYNKVIYKDYKEYMFDEACDIFIAERYPSVFNKTINSRLNYLWVHDLCPETKDNSEILKNLEKIHKIITVSNFQKDNYQIILGIDDSKFVISRNGINPSFFKKKLKKENRIIWTSSPMKRGNLILKIFPQILERYPNIELWMYHYIWPGLDPGDFYERAEKIKNIKIKGSCSQKELAEEIMKSKLMIHPNSYPETSCISAIEAQAAGTPFITTDIGALKETIANEKTGYLIKEHIDEPGYINKFLNVVFELLENKQLYEDITKAGKKRIKKYYEWKTIAKEINTYFIKELGGKSNTKARKWWHNIFYKKKTIKFSVIIPNYNNGKYLDQAIKSVIKQSYPYWELIIVDDCSTDNSIDTIKKHLNDKRIMLFRNRENKGISATRNKCVKESKNSIIVQLDSDDFLEKNALETIRTEFSKDKDLVLCYSDLNRIIDGKKVMTRMPDINSFEEWKIKPHAFHISSYKKRIIERFGGFKESLKTCEDINFYYKIFENNLKFKHIKKILYNWRINPKGITQTTNMKCVECKHGEKCVFYNNFKEINLIKKIQ